MLTASACDIITLPAALWLHIYARNTLMLQVFLTQLVHAALAGERALLYALDFQLEMYDVHDRVLRLQADSALGEAFSNSEDGRDMFKVAFDSVTWPYAPIHSLQFQCQGTTQAQTCCHTSIAATLRLELHAI